MDNVQFEEEKVNSQFFRKSQIYSGLIGLIVKMKLAKNDVQASIILGIIMVLCIISTIFIIIGSTSNTTPSNIKPLTADSVRDLMSFRPK